MTLGTPDKLVDDTVSFTLDALKASAVVFYWIDSDLKISTDCVAGLPDTFMSDYDLQRISKVDPLNIQRMTTQRRRYALCGSMSHECDVFANFMARYNIDSALEMLFWTDDAAFAGMCIMKQHQDPPFQADSISFASAMQPYIESNLRKHGRFLRQKARSALQAKYNVTARELDIVNLICSGKTNSDISEILGISVYTVKAHLKNIFAKTGSDNRASLISCVGGHCGIEWREALI